MFLDLSESSWVKWSPHDHLHSQATLGVDGGHSHWWVQALRSHDGQMTTKHCTQWYTVYKARCSGAEGAKLSLKQTRTWLLGGNIVENQPETVWFALQKRNWKIYLNTSCWMKKESLAGLRTKFCMKDCGMSSSVCWSWQRININGSPPDRGTSITSHQVEVLNLNMN